MDRYETLLAPYAARPSQSKGRLIAEAPSQMRNPFQRDRDRIIHSVAFRRLKNKTQVFVVHEGDHYRTRLTHTMEVAQIARGLARSLFVQEDLAEAVALAHDLGHPPFGHCGEDALHAVMQEDGGFNHNDQSLRVVAKLEKRYAAFEGLNLSWEILEGLAKHNGPVTKRPLPPTIAWLDAQCDLRLDSWASIEAQIGNLADDIAYNNHDLDDGLRAGLFNIEDLFSLPMLGPIAEQAHQQYGAIDRSILANEIVRRLMGCMVTDVVTETNNRLAILNPQTPDDIRNAPQATVSFSPDMQQSIAAIRKFLMLRMYRHPHVNQMNKAMYQVVTDLFHRYDTQPSDLPVEWQKMQEGQDNSACRRIVLDYVAGMTDSYALKQHVILFASNATGDLPNGTILG